MRKAISSIAAFLCLCGILQLPLEAQEASVRRLFRGIEEDSIIRIRSEVKDEVLVASFCEAVDKAKIAQCKYFRFERTDEQWILVSPADDKMTVVYFPIFLSPNGYWSFDADWVHKTPDYKSATLRVGKARQPPRTGWLITPALSTTIRAINEAQ